MRIHTCLWHEVDAFNFQAEDVTASPPSGMTFIHHRNNEDFLAVAGDVDVLLTWEFPIDWYKKCPDLKMIITPAAGNDWVAHDPAGRVQLIHGTFHGDILAESLLSAILFMNHNMPRMIQNHRDHKWNRNLQTQCRLLANQKVLIIGMGSIGQTCAEKIRLLGAEVTGIRRDTVSKLDQLLPYADHVVLLLPGGDATNRFMSPARIAQCKPGAFLYNFGRGNALASEDIVRMSDHIGGAFLDVTDVEPLPPDSPVWNLPNVMVTPHSSCVYTEYKSMFLEQAIDHIRKIDEL